MNKTVHVFRDLPTVLTGSYVASASIPIHSIVDHHFVVTYDPDESDGRLEIQFQISDDSTDVTDANSEWTTIGTNARVAGVLTFTADTLRMDSAGAGTKSYAQVSYENAPAYKLRIRAVETFTGAGTNQGNVRITYFGSSHDKY